MNLAELSKILELHKVWLNSPDDQEGSKASLRGAELPDHTFFIMGEKYEIIITNGEYVLAN